MSTTQPPASSPPAADTFLQDCDDTSAQLNNLLVAMHSALGATTQEGGVVVPGLPDEPLASEHMQALVQAIVEGMIGPVPPAPTVNPHDDTFTPYYLFTFNPHDPRSPGVTCRASNPDAALQMYNLLNDPDRKGAFPDLAVTRVVEVPSTGEAGEGGEASTRTEVALYPWPFHVVDLTTGACWHHGAGPGTLECEHFGLPIAPDDDTPARDPSPAPALVVLGQRTGEPMPRAKALAKLQGREVSDYSAPFGADVFEAHLPSPGSWGAWCVYGWLPASMGAPPTPQAVCRPGSTAHQALTAWMRRGAQFVLEFGTGRIFTCVEDGGDLWLVQQGVVENADVAVKYADEMAYYASKHARFSDLVRLVILLNMLADWRWLWTSGMNQALGSDGSLTWGPTPMPIPVVNGTDPAPADLVAELTDVRRAALFQAAARILRARHADADADADAG